MTGVIEETMNNNLLPRIVLIACGSFSPPTPMHFRMFEIARDHFELRGTHEVIGGIVSPTHDSYGKKGLAAGVHRFAMLKLAAQSSTWIRASDWEISQPKWSRTQAVLQHHQFFMNNYLNSAGMGDWNGHTPSWLPPGLNDRCDHVQLKLLCGADLLESFAVPGLWTEHDIEDIVAHHGLVVITRNGANPEKFIFESDILTKYQRNITLITNWVPNDVSSTLIRRLLSRGQSVKYLIDDLVIEYIKQHGLFDWKAAHIAHSRKNVYNEEYMNQVNINTSNKPQPQPQSDDDDDDDDEDEESDDDDDDDKHMDVMDYAIKNILTNVNRTPKVICCGESKVVNTKQLVLNRHLVGPGQAVKVITTERGTQRLNDSEEITAKKMKTSAAQNV